MLAIVAPGQGAQTPGFLSPWIQESSARDLVATWSEEIGLDLLSLGTTAGADEIRETSHAQPLLVAAGLISFMQTFDQQEIPNNFFAGHSVGEITAASLAGVLDASTAMKLVNVRARAMSAAATNSHTGMSAVLGGERDVVIAALASLGLTAANENGAGQIVAAGDLAALEKLAENPPEGSRVRPLAVSGAFHTSVMNPAVSALQAATNGEKISDARIAVLSNKDGAIVRSGSDLIARIVGQVAGPVRWDLCMKTLADSGVTGVIEVAPGGTLVGLLKRAEPSIQTFALKTPDDISGARAFAKEHGGK